MLREERKKMTILIRCFASLPTEKEGKRKTQAREKNKELALKLKRKVKMLEALMNSVRCYREKLHVWALIKPFSF